MRSLVRYAFEVNIGVPYLLAFPLVFFAPAPVPVSVGIYGFMAIPLLAIAAALRRNERKRGRIRPSAVETRLRGLAHIPKAIGTADKPSVIGIAEREPYVNCDVLAAALGEEVRVLVAARWWPFRVRDILVFHSVAEWRAWAKEHEVRLVREGPYADAVFGRYFEANLHALDGPTSAN